MTPRQQFVHQKQHVPYMVIHPRISPICTAFFQTPMTGKCSVGLRIDYDASHILARGLPQAHFTAGFYFTASHWRLMFEPMCPCDRCVVDCSQNESIQHSMVEFFGFSCHSLSQYSQQQSLVFWAEDNMAPISVGGGTAKSPDGS